MQSYLVITFLSTLLPLVLTQGTYDSKYDNFDIKPLLENERILISYTKCFLDKGPCTPDVKEFKKVIPEAIETTCGKCTPKQKQLIKTVVKTLRERNPDAWNELVAKYDKDMKYRDNFTKFLDESS